MGGGGRALGPLRPPPQYQQQPPPQQYQQPPPQYQQQPPAQQPPASGAGRPVYKKSCKASLIAKFQTLTPPPPPPKKYHHGQNCYKKFLSNTIFRNKSFCSYYKNTLHFSYKRSPKYYKIVVSGNYFVIISARMVLNFAFLSVFLGEKKGNGRKQKKQI